METREESPDSQPPHQGPGASCRPSVTASLITSKNSPDLKSSGQVIVQEAQRGMRILQGNLNPVVDVARGHGRECTAEQVTAPLGPSASPFVKWRGWPRSGMPSNRHASHRSGAPGGRCSWITELCLAGAVSHSPCPAAPLVPSRDVCFCLPSRSRPPTSSVEPGRAYSWTQAVGSATHTQQRSPWSETGTGCHAKSPSSSPSLSRTSTTCDASADPSATRP